MLRGSSWLTALVIAGAKAERVVVDPDAGVGRGRDAAPARDLPVDKTLRTSDRPAVRFHQQLHFRQRFHVPPEIKTITGTAAVRLFTFPSAACAASAGPTGCSVHLAPRPHNTTSTVEIRIMRSRNRLCFFT